VEDATHLLRPLAAQQPSPAAAHLLLCRVAYAQEIIDDAVKECEAAASISPSSSEVQLWLGRAYGREASSANPLLAFSLARKVRDAFERSVRLDPANLAAGNDLGEFYVTAPLIVGGGPGKARRLSASLRSLGSPAATAASHRVLALLAEKEKDQATAEAEFQQAASVNAPIAPNSAGPNPPSPAAASQASAAWIDLAAFYARHGQPDRAASAVRTGVSLDRARGANLVDAAGVLTDAGRDPDLAIHLLREYLSSTSRSDAAPAFKVRLQLGNLLSRSGDLASARQQYALALALAPTFPPARRAVETHPPRASR